MAMLLKNMGFFISRGKNGCENRCFDSDELMYIVSGTFRMYVGGEEFECGPGSVLYAPAGVRHGGKAAYPFGFSFYWIHFSGGTREREPYAKASHFSLVLRHLELMCDYQQEFPENKTANDILLNLLVGLPSVNAAEEPDDPLAAKAKEIIRLRFREDLSPSSIAGELGYSANYLGIRFRRSYGMPLTDCLNEVRIEHAARLLRESQLRISEILFDSGYNDPAYFRRHFLRRYGVTPGQYRKNAAANSPGKRDETIPGE